jgi:uncharacterized membrane protein YedE/YeeE
MENFTPIPALAGGVLIGLASAALWLGNGRIAGISGLFGRLLPFAVENTVWRATFLVALILGTLGAAWLIPGLGVGGPGGRAAALAAAPAWMGVSTPVWIGAAGLLTGLGTRLANGCTSGHGVCGLARLSPRSLIAVGTFFLVAILTVAVTGIV